MIFFQDYKPLAYKPEEKTVQSFINISRYNTATIYKALVAQLDRVSPSEGEGRGFDSRRAHQIFPVAITLVI